MLHIMSLTSPHNPPVDYIIKGNALQKNTSSRNLRLGMQQCATFSGHSIFCEVHCAVTLCERSLIWVSESGYAGFYRQ